MPSIEIKILNPRLGRDIPAPAYATAGAAGIDLRACENHLLLPQEVVMVETGVAIFLRDPKLFGLLTVRSGLGRRGVAFANGVGIIDSDYQGEIIAALFNGGRRRAKNRRRASESANCWCCPFFARNSKSSIRFRARPRAAKAASDRRGGFNRARINRRAGRRRTFRGILRAPNRSSARSPASRRRAR